VSAAKSAIDRYGTTASASRLTVQTRVHVELERALLISSCRGRLVFSGGHAQRDHDRSSVRAKDLILCDASFTTGGRRSQDGRRSCHSFAHDDWQMRNVRWRSRVDDTSASSSPSKRLQRGRRCRRCSSFRRSRRRYQCFLSSTSALHRVLGPRGGAYASISASPSDVDLWMGTLSKSS